MKITIIGGGNMGSTYARAFLQNNVVKKEDLFIVEKNNEKTTELQKELGFKMEQEIGASISQSNTIIIAVKPQDFRILAEELKKHLHPSQMIISIMAGVTIEKISQLLHHKNVVRAMPNTPAQLGFGITAFTVSEGSNFEDISTVDNLLETTGKAIFMKDEKMLDAVTALSGSGPAYFYYFVKHMIEAGKQMGVDESVASQLIKQTMLGSFQIINTSKLSLDEMIKMVASKGGTTEAALNTFDQMEVGNNIIKALSAAEKRAKELSQGV
jgi:pyrroline-5-carboxylate reductase